MSHHVSIFGSQPASARLGGKQNDVPIVDFDDDVSLLVHLTPEGADWLRATAASLLDLADSIDTHLDRAGHPHLVPVEG